ncbi:MULTISPECIES: SAM-dependent methyltransferase [Caulobacter]|jgi:cyclopropane-fatty-acyl-phospholipid synthase|uniref:SAM-dependent methyltransferase n=1 Tax=Caulobacter TaxID=75 RepID=UPI0006F8C3F8|nr:MULTISPECIES: cyclopropane-fatty-acyl-phospholipid synthase family protein [Caulobacter]KQZ28342.1 cyclopropane-fatty-acyl-phospholipid synthase [Caulobacter sp. Root1472]GGL10105.1 cyclopropane-fatty-acyl-phospholipid synthase [Caulobacter rhizosphaerae]
MSLLAASINRLQDAPCPDFIVRPAIGALVANARRQLARTPGQSEADFAAVMAARPIAEHTQAANVQHYELPARFFELVLGPRLKYSSAYYETPDTSLAQAEEAALARTCRNAGLADGQAVLELGCGWGSLSLWMAAAYPAATITAVSNSHGQKAFIDQQARERGLANLTVVTADMNDFATSSRFDRIVSVEMFEHMANWRALLTRVRAWLTPGGRAFVHVFAHRAAPYRFEVEDRSDFIAQHFFTGGLMPSHGLMHQYPDLFAVEADWRWSGAHYARTADDWLVNFDRHEREIMGVMRSVYGQDAVLWARRWRRFFLATAGLFGDRGGAEWGVSHYRLAPV